MHRPTTRGSKTGLSALQQAGKQVAMGNQAKWARMGLNSGHVCIGLLQLAAGGARLTGPPAALPAMSIFWYIEFEANSLQTQLKPLAVWASEFR